MENKFKNMTQWTVKTSDGEMDHFCLRGFSLFTESSLPANGCNLAVFHTGKSFTSYDHQLSTVHKATPSPLP